MSPQREPRIIRAERTSRRFQVVDKSPFSRGSPLSIEARGMLASLLMYPDTWEIRPRMLAEELGIGRDRCYRLLGELMSHGYLTRERARDAKGRLVWGDYTLYEHPGDAPEPLPDIQDMDGAAPGADETPRQPLPENQDMATLPLPEYPDTGSQEMDKTAVSGVETPSRPYPEYPYMENQDTHRIYIDRSSMSEYPPPPPPTPSTAAPDAADAAGGGGERKSNPETRQLLQAAGVKSARALRRLGHLDPAIVRRTVKALERESGLKTLAGTLVATLDEYLISGEEIAQVSPRRPPAAAPPLPPSDAPPLDPARRAELVAAARNGQRKELRP